MNTTQALIVGAGPTGLTLACELARRNINVRIIDRAATYPQGSRAKGLQPRSLEVFDDLGIVDEIVSNGAFNVIFRMFDGDKPPVDVAREVFPRNDTRYPQGLLIPQWKIEEILRNKLASYNVRVELGTELTSFSQTDDKVTAVLTTTQGTEEAICDYLIGCDGGKSNVRKSLGINFVGETHEDERAFVGDVEVEGLIPDAWHIWKHPQYGFGFALCPFKGTNSWQVQAIAMPDADGNMPEPNLETFRKVFKERTNMPNVVLKNATWQSLYRVNVRMADKYRVGRVFIAGDAAHAHSIAGGLGMNTGIQDAYNLGWKLATVLKGEAKSELLNTYEEERLPIAAWTLNISSERQQVMTDAMKKGTGGFQTIGTKDTTQLNLNYRYSSLSINKDNNESGLQAGDRAPDAELENGTRLFDLYRGPGFTVLGISSSDKTINDINAHFVGKVHAHLLTGKAAINVFGKDKSLIVVRPDGYFGLITGAGDVDGVFNYLQKL